MAGRAICLGLLLSTCAQEPAEEAPEAYWLRDSYVLTDPSGSEAHFMAGPRRVALFVDGRVEADGAALGYLDVAAPPHPGRGLILYAARTAPLHDMQRRDVIWGRLRAGAQVAVRPVEGGYEVAPGPPFGQRRFFVARRDLTAEPTELEAAFSEGAFCMSLRWRPGEADAIGWTDPCVAVILGPEPGRVRQRWMGVELDGRGLGEARCKPIEEPRACVAEAVVEQEGAMRWLPAPGVVPRDVDALPSMHRRLAKGNRLERHLERADAVFVRTRGGGTCASLPTHVSAPSLLEVGRRITASGSDIERSALRGHFETGRSYLEVGGDDDHVDLIALELRDDAVSYAITDVERWFFSQEACEAAGDVAFRRDEGLP